jgi:hypothetical protein
MDPTCETADQKDCNPLAEIKRLATAIKALSIYEAGVNVLAITGWPNPEDPAPSYRIAPIPSSPDGATSSTRTLGPVCRDRDQPLETDPPAVGLSATPALRIAAFLDQFPQENIVRSSVCHPTLYPIVKGLFDTWIPHLRSLCLPRRLYDTNLAMDGIQGDCTVTEESTIQVPSGPGLSTTAWQTSGTIPACESNPATVPCWRIERKEDECPSKATVPSQKIIIQRDDHSYPQPRTRINLTCLTCPEMREGIPPASAACGGK